MFNVILRAFENTVNGVFFDNPIEGAFQGVVLVGIASTLYTVAGGNDAAPGYSDSVSQAAICALFAGAAVGFYNEHMRRQEAAPPPVPGLHH